MKLIKEFSGVVALVILAIMGVSGVLNDNSKALFGSTSCGSITCLAGGLRLVSDLGGTFEVDIATAITSLTTTGDVTVGGGTVSVTGTNAATSTVKGGCIQLVATSTGNPIRLSVGATSITATTTTTGIATLGVFAEFGTCPNL